MKSALIGGLAVLFYAANVHADCSGLACQNVKVTTVEIGKTGPLIATSGDEGALTCSDVYGKLSVRPKGAGAVSTKALLEVASEFGLTVDVYLKDDVNTCVVEHLVVYSPGQNIGNEGELRYGE